MYLFLFLDYLVTEHHPTLLHQDIPSDSWSNECVITYPHSTMCLFEALQSGKSLVVIDSLFKLERGPQLQSLSNKGLVIPEPLL